MTYQVLARKWRPQDFSSIVGQQPVVTALRNAVAEQRIAQAYLFSGIRGVGKTTAARVFAKALNCERRKEAVDRGDASSFLDPCNECLPCREITNGADLDVIEIDAATYSKVEQVRELTESLQYGPTKDTYKVVVLDEIHRLSRQAFDALLKIVEEPPPHLVFIFATTEVEAVPATILSRCQEFHFRRVPAAELTPLLRTICDEEDIEANDRALRLIARAGEGSVRDSVALLDQLATFGSGSVSDEEAVRLLGGLDFSFLFSLLEAILGGAPERVIAALHHVEELGWDPRRVHTQLLAYCRDALHSAVGASLEQLDLPQDDAEALAKLAGSAGYENLLRLLQQLLKSEEIVRRSAIPGLAVEISWLKAAELPKLIEIEALLAGNEVPAAPVKSQSERDVAEALESEPAADSEAPKDEGPIGSEVAPPAGPALSKDLKTAFLELVSHRKQPLAARLREAIALDFADGELSISIPRGDPWIREPFERENNRALISEIVKEIWGAGSQWRVVEIDPNDVLPPKPDVPPPPATDDSPDATRVKARALEHPVVQSALDLFSGTIESVELLPSSAGAISARAEGEE